MKLVIGGATGFMGAELLRQALAKNAIKSVVTITRRPVSVGKDSDKSKLQEIILEDFMHYPESAKRMLADADACIWTVALTPYVAVTRQWKDVKRICHDYALAAFNTMLESRATDTKLRFIYYSGIASQRDQDRFLIMPLPGYARMRGQIENDLLKGASESDGRAEVCILKPGPILGRRFIGRGPLNTVAKTTGLPFVKLEDCCAATFKQCIEGIEQETLENGDLQRIGASYLAEAQATS